MHRASIVSKTLLLFQLMHTVNAYQPAQQADMPPYIDCVYTDELRKTIFVVLVSTGLFLEDGSCVNRNKSEKSVIIFKLF
jgi:hypothetical protein